MELSFEKLVLREVRIPFRFKFKHSLAERREANNLIIEITDSKGSTGYGEVLPREYLSGESIASCREDIAHRWWPLVKKIQIGEKDSIREVLQPIYKQADRERKTASYSGVDIAVWDCYSRSKGVTANSFFGQSATDQILSAPLGGNSLSSTSKITRLFKWLGFRHYKLKVGTGEDLKRIEKVRKIIGDEADLRVDANAAWTVEQSIEMARKMGAWNVSSIEQPVPASSSPADLARIQQEGGLPVMADESLCTTEDAKLLLAHNSAKIWNVRLAKVGGFSGFLTLLDLAQANGIKIHHGVLVGETSLLAAASRACAGLHNYKHVEYGFPRILLKDDPFRGGPAGYFGTGKPLSQQKTGLGVNPVEQIMDRVTVTKEIYI